MSPSPTYLNSEPNTTSTNISSLKLKKNDDQVKQQINTPNKVLYTGSKLFNKK